MNNTFYQCPWMDNFAHYLFTAVGIIWTICKPFLTIIECSVFNQQITKNRRQSYRLRNRHGTFHQRIPIPDLCEVVNRFKVILPGRDQECQFLDSAQDERLLRLIGRDIHFELPRIGSRIHPVSEKSTTKKWRRFHKSLAHVFRINKKSDCSMTHIYLNTIGSNTNHH